MYKRPQLTDTNSDRSSSFIIFVDTKLIYKFIYRRRRVLFSIK